MKIGLISLNFKLQASTTPGVYPFTASITSGGRISDGYVGGTETVPGGPYRVLIPTSVLSAKIQDLAGKPAFAAEGLDDHADGVTVGEFKDSWIEPVIDDSTGEYISLARASGLLNSEENEALVSQIVSGARQGLMGFSYDLSKSHYRIENIDGEDIFVATDFEWLGATILKRDKAAYRNTRLAASKVKPEDKTMSDKDKNKGDTPQDIQAQVAEANKPVLEAVEKMAEGFGTLTEHVSKMKDDVKSLTERVEASEAQVKALQDKDAKPAPQASATEPPKPADKPTEPAKPDNKGTILSADDLATKIGDSVAEKIVAGLKKLNGDTTADPDNKGGDLTGQRKTTGPGKLAEHFVTMHAKGADYGETELGTIEGCEIALAHIKAHVKNRNQRLAAIADIAAAKRALKRGYHPRTS